MKKKTDITIEGNKEAEEWKNKYLRALADYQNLEKRVAGEKTELRRFAAEVVISRILPTLDTLAKAKAHIQDPGLDLAYKELEGALTDLGVKKINVLGKEFNPHEMECIEVVAGEDNKVMEELLPGYTLHEKVIRVAQVKVGKKLQN
jgi:molecular chaperone GrpE